MKSLAIFLLGTSSLGFAATINFGFEGSSLAPAVSGSGFNTGALAETYSSTAPGAIYGGFVGANTPTATTTVRAWRPNDVTNLSVSTTSALFNSHTSYMEFTVAPDAGNSLDFSSANFSFTLGTFVGEGSPDGITNRAAVGYRINGTGDFVLLGTDINTVGPAYTSSPTNWTGQASFNSTPNTFLVVENALSRSLSGIPSLNAGDTITFRVILGDTGNTNVGLTAASAVRGGYIDNIAVSGFNVIPEPAPLLLSSLAVFPLLRRRRIV